MLDAFRSADQVLLSGVQGITDLITTPGLINLDFADVKSVMQGAGSALMGIGSARGEDRAVQAAETAISSPLLEASVDGAHGVLLSIQGGSDLGLFEINEAARLVQEAAHPEANIIFGAVIDDALGDEVRVTVIAAGFDGGAPDAAQERPCARPGLRPPSRSPAPGVCPRPTGSGLNGSAPPARPGAGLGATAVAVRRTSHPRGSACRAHSCLQRPQPLDAEPVVLRTSGPAESRSLRELRRAAGPLPPRSGAAAGAPGGRPAAGFGPSRPGRPVVLDEDLDVPDFLK